MMSCAAFRVLFYYRFNKKNKKKVATVHPWYADGLPL